MSAVSDHIKVPCVVWELIKGVLRNRAQVSDDYDEDNDYEVLAALEEMKETEKNQ